MGKQENSIEDGELVELVSEKIHNHWMIWAKELMASEPNISTERKIRWESECFVNYENLSEEMKELDRKFATEIIKTILKYEPTPTNRRLQS